MSYFLEFRNCVVESAVALKRYCAQYENNIVISESIRDRKSLNRKSFKQFHWEFIVTNWAVLIF